MWNYGAHRVSFYLSTTLAPLPLLLELFVSSSSDSQHCRKRIRIKSSALATASVRAHFLSRGAEESAFYPTITVNGRIYHEMGAPNPSSGLKPLFASVSIHDTEQALENGKHF